MNRHDDSGLTLVELLVATAIAALIAPVLTSALVLGWRTSAATIDRLSDTRDRQLVPSLFTRDVQNARAVEKSVAPDTCKLPGDTLLVQLTVVQPTGSSAVTRSVGWVLTPTELVERRLCASGSSAVISSVTAAHGVTAAAAYCRSANGAARTSACPTRSRIVDLDVTDGTGRFTATGSRRPT